MELQSKSVPRTREGCRGVTYGTGSALGLVLALRRRPPGVAREGGSVACTQQVVWKGDET